MTKEEIIQGLQFTIDMFLFDPNTGETLKKPRNDMDKITIDSCREAIKSLELQACEDCISREAVLAMSDYIGETPTYSNPYAKLEEVVRVEDIKSLPPVQPKTEIKPIGYRECSDAMLKMWMDNVLTDGEYYRIMDKLNAKWSKMNEVKS